MPSKRSLKIDLRRAATPRPSTQQGPQQLATPSSQPRTLSHKRKAAVEAPDPPPARRKAKVKAKVKAKAKAKAKASASTPRALGSPSTANQPIHISSDTEGLDKGGSGSAPGSSPPPPPSPSPLPSSPPPPPSPLPSMSPSSAAIRRQFVLPDPLGADLRDSENERREDNDEEEDQQPMPESIHFSCTFEAICGKESIECGTDAFDTENKFASWSKLTY
ncbi:hypothetical protein B0A49_12474 [Cryomyces minteri]|uniref:Uncharacterized protein n=1 Tax=Cryomyces minteri TaxID=331657 RepID=A0A4U0W315_9PEZI|nr:hypothetical protein B0A49_12474 [Cryomyces minteri]